MHDNASIAGVFTEMADLLEIQGGDRYRVRAFRRIARVLENLREPVASLIKRGGLQAVPGIGEGAVGRIKDILRSGTCGEHRHLRSTLPAGLRDLLQVRGIGVKTARHLWTNYRIGSVEELEAAARAGRLAGLPGFGEGSSDRILEAIARFRRHTGRLLLPEALALGGAMAGALREEPAALQVELTGSARRRKETVGDLDLLVAARDPAAVVAAFVVLPQIEEVLVRGESKCSALVTTGQQVDLRAIEPEAWGAGLHYFTGSQQHNIYLRARGNRRRLKISEHGVFRRGDERLVDACAREEDLFGMVGLPFIPPELRENTGELEAAEQGKLPALVELAALQGDLHAHAAAADPAGAARLAAAAAAEGLAYIAITNNTRALPHPLDAELDALRRLRDSTGAIRVVAGIEVDVRPDGTLDVDPARLAPFDWVLATVRDALDQPRAEMTRRIVRAIESGAIDCLAHPTNRVIGERDAVELDLEKVLKAARRHEVALELNADPRRLDLDATTCRWARELRIPISISAAAHEPRDLARRAFGVFTARRGWLEARDVLNAGPYAAIEKRRRERLARGATIRPAKEPSGSRSEDPLGALRAGDAPSGPPVAAGLPPALAREVDLLEAALRESPLLPETLERLDLYFREGSDEALERALRRISGNPLQKAYELLFASDASGLLREEGGHEPGSDD